MYMNKYKNIVDIVIPIHNEEESLRDALDSVLNQTVTDWRCYLIDDGSTDNSLAICKEYADKDERFEVLHFKVNKGISEALNAGLSKGEAPYIARLDGDDQWLPFHLALLLAEMELDTNLAIVGSLLSTDKAILGTTLKPDRADIRVYDGEKLWYELSQQNVISHPTVVLRRSLLGDLRYNSLHNGYEDWHLWSRLVTKTNARILGATTVYYGVDPTVERHVDMVAYRLFRRRLTLSRKKG